jgi:glycosyltransferase involved in cell wall biosynthesis
MRIALLSFNFGQYCIRLANGLAQHGQVLLLLPRSISEPYRLGLAPEVELFQFDEPRLRQATRQPRMIAAILRKLKSYRPDVVHLQAGHLWFNLVWPFVRSYVVVVTIHHLGDRDSLMTPQWVMDLGYRRADRVIVHGESLRAAVVEDIGLERDIIDVVPAVPDIVLDPAAPAPAAEVPGTILFFGRIWPYKGLQFLIRAEPLISAHVPNTRIVIAGQGEDFETYRRLMSHPERFVVLNEYIPDAELVDLFGQASVVVLPYVEGSISGVVPIACTFGKPVVATSVGILPEMVEHGRTGLVVPPQDESALAAALTRLLQDDVLRHELGEHARAKAQTTFDPASVAGTTMATYERAIAARTPRPRGRLA